MKPWSLWHGKWRDKSPPGSSTHAIEEKKAKLKGPFRSDHYVRHNQRRQEHLASLGLALDRRSVLEFGSGIGDHTTFFLDRNCAVCATEGRPELYDILRERYPQIRTELIDLEHPDEAFHGVFDIVYAYGVLYHVGDPARALAYMSKRCGELLLLETCVSPGDDLSINLVPEEKERASQAISGTGCRPTRRWIFEQLLTEFVHVYATVTQPWHAEFPTDWDAIPSDGTLTRAVFVASRKPLDLPTLTSELPRIQPRH
jgi:hypothetical protein